jgi:hypothetical protein
MQDLRYYESIVKRKGEFKKRCLHCNKKFEVGDVIEYIVNSGGYHPFCLGHLEEWANLKRRSYLLEKL